MWPTKMNEAMFWPRLLACTIAGFGGIGAVTALLPAHRPAAAPPVTATGPVPATATVAAAAASVASVSSLMTASSTAFVPHAVPVAAAVEDVQQPDAPAAAVTVSDDVFDAHDARARALQPAGVAVPVEPARSTAPRPVAAPAAQRTPRQIHAAAPDVPVPAASAQSLATPTPLVSRPDAVRADQNRPAAVVYREELLPVDAGAATLVHLTDRSAWVRINGTRTMQVRVGETVPGLGALRAIDGDRARFDQRVLTLRTTDSTSATSK